MNEVKRPFWQIPVENRMPFDTSPIGGYKAPKRFPDCCPFHKKAFKDAKEWFEKFPNCCDPHRDLAKAGRIKKSDYEGLPQKILDRLSFTEYHIKKQIDIPEWYEDITNYIDYNWLSFGQPPIGFHLYCIFLKGYLEVTKSKIPNDKRRRLIQYIEDYNKPKVDASKFDLNVLYDTLQKWVKTFPFELPYFKGLKIHFEGKIPAFKEPARFNPYTRMAKAKALTQAELIDALDATTKRLLGEVQADKMLAEGQILDISKHRLELANESLRVGTAKLLGDYSKGELRYVTTLKKWLDLQKTYFKEVVDIMGGQTSRPLSNKGLSPKILALCYIYRQENGSHPHFPHGQKVREIERIARENGVDKKNLELAYNLFNASKKRLANVKLPDLERVIELLVDFPLAQKAARDELSILKARNE